MEWNERREIPGLSGGEYLNSYPLFPLATLTQTDPPAGLCSRAVNASWICVSVSLSGLQPYTGVKIAFGSPRSVMNILVVLSIEEYWVGLVGWYRLVFGWEYGKGREEKRRKDGLGWAGLG